MNVFDECECADRNAIVTDNECACDNGYKEKGTECVRCAVDEVDSNGECTNDDIEGIVFWDYAWNDDYIQLKIDTFCLCSKFEQM